MLTAEELATRDGLAEWARQNHPDPNVRANAAQNYDVRAATIDTIVTIAATFIAEALPGVAIVTMVEGQKNYQEGAWEMRANPSAMARGIHEIVSQVMARVKTPRVLEKQVLPIQRMTWNAAELRRKRDARPDHSTVVIVRFVAAGVGARLIVVLAE